MENNTIYRVTSGECDYYQVHRYFTALESAKAHMRELAEELKEAGAPRYEYTWFRIEAMTFDANGTACEFDTLIECEDAFPEL